MRMYTAIAVCCILTSDGDNTVSIPKFISDTAGVVSNDVLNVIIHYKCVLVSGAPSGCHYLIKLVLHSINRQCNAITHPSHSGSR